MSHVDSNYRNKTISQNTIKCYVVLYFRLFQKAQNNKELIQNEIQERHSFTKEIIALKKSFQQTAASLQNLELQEHPEKSEEFEVSEK